MLSKIPNGISVHPIPYKRTGDISVSPVHQQQFFVARPVFSGNFPRFSQCLPLKNTTKIVARPVSPVLSCSKIGRPSFYTGGGGVESTLLGNQGF